MSATLPSMWCCTASMVESCVENQNCWNGSRPKYSATSKTVLGPRGMPWVFQLSIVRSHHIAHSQRGRRSTGWKLIVARKRST